MRTEGIKCLNDPYRLQNQMSIPVCFVFRLADVLCREDACFSSGNVQRSHDFKTGNDSFDELDFDAIYHDPGPINSIGSISMTVVWLKYQSEIS